MDRAANRRCLTVEGVEERWLLTTVASLPRIVYLKPVPEASTIKASFARLISSREKVSGAIVYFSGPVDPVSSADPRRYVLVDDHKVGVKDWLSRFTFKSNSQGTLYFNSARYDAADNSVTLTLPKPVSNLGRYRLGAAWNDVKPKVRVPTDTQGGIIPRFSVELNGNGGRSRIGR